MERNGTMLEEAFVSVLGGIDGMVDRVSPIADIQKSTGPLLVFSQLGDGEERSLEGRIGLMTAQYELHVLHNSYRSMRHLAERTKDALQKMETRSFPGLLVEQLQAEIASPDIFEQRVSLFRRTYRVTIFYQFKEE